MPSRFVDIGLGACLPIALLACAVWLASHGAAPAALAILPISLAVAIAGAANRYARQAWHRELARLRCERFDIERRR